MGKSGTRSIAAMFLKPVRTGHEPEALPLMRRCSRAKPGQLSESDFFRTGVGARDRRLALDVDSSNLNSHILDFLVNPVA